MTVVIWTLAGALTGILLHMLIAQKGLSEMGCVVTGAAAALVGGLLIAPLLGLTEPGELNLVGLVVALMSAVVGLSVASLRHEDV